MVYFLKKLLTSFLIYGINAKTAEAFIFCGLIWLLSAIISG
ncbi:hypothetical protein RUMGNA_01565 [Mediterraneibacter gnavus ATCC 29149]|uniref:Uncharacterized protein n=1 Tax=Mediterraneibacter gnavus (strain ATCC 29149 / DSM 114966 / JCM 6515 / VPI C7-9) TaxID=411470 RepID=A7B1Y9_MEDG7|nr:hypothetical protein RUMGNA_01565 [Mediterraneibacter gnavus ATCC 29149]